MQQNTIILLIIGGIILITYLNNKYNKNCTNCEPFIDVDKERFSNVNMKENLCLNFEQHCVDTNNQECEDVSMVACQKYKIKCNLKCENKKLDDSDKVENDINKCLETCNQVKTDCCNRLNNIT